MARGGDLLAARGGLGDTLRDLTNVGDPLLGLRKGGDPLLVLTTVEVSFSDLMNTGDQARDPARDLAGVGDPARECEVVGDPLLDLADLGDLLRDLASVSDPFRDFEGEGDPLRDLAGVNDPLLDLAEVGDPLRDLEGVSDPFRDLEGVGDPLRDFEGVGEPLKVPLRLDRSWGVTGALFTPWWHPSDGGTRRLRLLGREGEWEGLVGALCVGGRVSSPGERRVCEDLREWVGEVWAETDARCRRWRRTLAARDPMLNRPDMLLWAADSASAARRLH